MDVVILGTGALNWHADERRTDRYGTVHLNHNPSVVYHDDAAPDRERFDTAPVGVHGRLVAVIVDTRPTSHIGDLARGVAPQPAPGGAEITLGAGSLFVEASRYGNTEIGVCPDDGRDHAWLDPVALYRCHDQIVRLELRP